MNYYERVNRPRAGKAVIFMPGSFCWCTLDLLVWKLTCWALIYGKQILFLIFPGHIPPFESWAGQSIQHETQNSHLKALFLCLFTCTSPPTSSTHFTSVCLSTPILTKLSDSFDLICAFYTFLPGNSFNLFWWNPEVLLKAVLELSQSVQSLSPVQLFATPWTAARQASLSITNSWSLLKLISIKSVMPSNHLILCLPLLLPPSIFLSIRVFSNESALCIRWPKYWSLSFNISPSNEHSGLTSFRIDWLDLLAVQGTLKSLIQHHSSKASIFQCSAFFMVQLSHPYMTTGKTIALTKWTFVGKVMSLLFNMLSRSVIAFLPRSKHLLISWL